MKKFKTSNPNYIKIILFIIIFLILFIYLSFHKLNTNYDNLTKFLLNDFDNNEIYNLRFLTNNLDKLINNYSFYPKNILYNK